MNKGFHKSSKTNVNQKLMYKELNREKQGERIMPNFEDSIKCSSDTWSIRKEHNRHAEWLKECRKQLENVNNMKQFEISHKKKKKKKVKIQCRNTHNWKGQGYWLKNVKSLLPRIAVQLNNILERERPLPDWMTFRRTVLCQKKKPSKG